MNHYYNIYEKFMKIRKIHNYTIIWEKTKVLVLYNSELILKVYKAKGCNTIVFNNFLPEYDITCTGYLSTKLTVINLLILHLNGKIKTTKFFGVPDYYNF